MEDSVAAKSKLPTKMFFISSSVFQSCALDSADLDVSQVVAGLSKGSLSIAGPDQQACIGASRARAKSGKCIPKIAETVTPQIEMPLLTNTPSRLKCAFRYNLAGKPYKSL